MNETISIHFGQISLMLLLIGLVPVVTRCGVSIEEYTKRNFTVTFFFISKFTIHLRLLKKNKKNLKWPYVAISTLDVVVLHCRYTKTNRLPAWNNVANKRISLVQYFFCIKVFSYETLPSQLVLQTAHVLKSQRLNVTHNTNLILFKATHKTYYRYSSSLTVTIAASKFIRRVCCLSVDCTIHCMLGKLCHFSLSPLSCFMSWLWIISFCCFVNSAAVPQRAKEQKLWAGLKCVIKSGATSCRDNLVAKHSNYILQLYIHIGQRLECNARPLSGVLTPGLESSAAVNRGRTTCQPPSVTSPCHRWPIQQCRVHPAFSLQRKKKKLRMLHCGLRPTKAEGALFGRLTCFDGEISESTG